MRRLNIILLTSTLITGCNQQTPQQDTISYQKDSVVQKPATKDTLKNLPTLDWDSFDDKETIDKAVIFSLKKFYADENMQNYMDFDLENHTKKTVTNVTIQLDSKTINLKVDLKPGQKKSFSHKTKEESMLGLALKLNTAVKKIRFSDSSFLTR